MPESVIHDEAVELLKLLLMAWIARSGAAARVARNLAVRWDELHPRVGCDPDVCLLMPPPPDADELTSLRTWLPGHEPPKLAIEVVSETNPHKDYGIAPDKYAASGTRELWIFDPTLAGPLTHGGPFRMQVWERNDAGELVRTYAGDGPCRSTSLGAWLVVREDGRKLRISDDPDGDALWPTPAEAERTEKERALARVAELEAEIARRK